MRIDQLNEQLHFQRERREVSTGLMGVLFGAKELPRDAIDRINEIRQEITNIKNITSTSDSLVKNQQYAITRIADVQQWLDKVCDRILKIENREAKQQSLKNKAASSTKTKRQIANGIKKDLVDNEDCPYCGYALKLAIHADHIYPIAKGGESTKKNMVLVCADCNTKKSSLTLQAFIKKYSLNREEIESRLEALGKDF